MTESTTETLLFLGTRTNPRDTTKTYQAFERLTADGKRSGEVRTFTPKRSSPISKLNVGRVYVVPTTGESYTFSAAEDRGPWPDTAERQAFVTASRAAEAGAAAHRRADKLAKDDVDLDAILYPLKVQYTKLRGRDERVAFELLVLHALRGH